MVQQNIEMGRCRVTANGTTLGETEGPVRLKVRTIWRERRSDRFGETVTERVALGTEVRVAMRLAEKTMDALKRALPTALVGTGFLGVGRAPGSRASEAAFELRLHPEERSDQGRDVVLHKAVAAEATAIEFGPGRTRGFDVEFTTLLDASKDDGELVGRLGQAD
jgi:hypothetical protein